MLSRKIIGRSFAVALIALFAFGIPTKAAELDLPRASAVRHLENIRGALRISLEEIFTEQKTSQLDKAGAMATVSHCINSEAITYWLQDTPLQIGKEMALRTVALVYAGVTGDASNALINSLEQLSIQQASQTALEWLRTHNIQTASGNLRGLYQDHRQERQNPDIQYTLAYHPQREGRGHVTAEFRSPHPVSPPPTTSRTIWDAISWRQTGRDKLPPFILTVDGPVQERHGLFEWTSRPQIKVTFPADVPDFQNPGTTGLWQRVTGGVFDWGQQQLDRLSAWLSPSPTPTQPQATTSELAELRQAVDELKETVENNQAPSTPLPLEQDLSDLIGGLATAATGLAGLSEESRAMGQEMAKIARYSAEIMKWQAENTSQPPATEEPLPEETEKEEPEEDASQDISEEETTICRTDSLTAPTNYPIILNEIAWMGRTSSANHEWIELRNLSDQEISLDGWQLFNRNQNLMVVFTEGDVILPRSYFLLVRTDESNVPGVKVDYVYTGALRNRDESLYLFDKDCRLQDFAQANPEWPAGDNATKRTMERGDGLEWQSSSSPHGTPRRANSSGYQEETSPATTTSSAETEDTNEPKEDTSDTQPPTAHAGTDQTVAYNQPVTLDASLSGDNIGIAAYRWDTNNDGLYNYVRSEPTLELFGGYFAPGNHTIVLQVADEAGNTDQDSLTVTVEEIPRMLINEIQFHGQTNRDEFIELYNPNPDDVDLAQWTLRKKTSGGTESVLVSSSKFEGTIPAQGYFLIATPQQQEDGTPRYQGETTPDLFYSGQTYYIAASNTILLYGPDGSPIDKVGYGEAQDYDEEPFPDNPPPGVSLGRRWLPEEESYADSNNNADDFQWQTPTPGQPNQPWEETNEPEEPEEQEEVFQDGSAEFPFRLSTCQDFLLIDDHLGAHYELTNDIDCQEAEEWNDGQGFQPIGQAGEFPFVGHLDGKGFTVSNLSIQDQEGYGGLFGRLNYPAQIINLKIEQFFLDNQGPHAGILAAVARGESQANIVIVDNVSVGGQINITHETSGSVGGLIGEIRDASITNSQAQIAIEANYQNGQGPSRIGGLIGQTHRSVVRNCSAHGQILGRTNVGGLIGRAETDGDIQENYASVEVTGRSMLGGFVGDTRTTSGTINNNYSTGTVSGCPEEGRDIGGFVGQSNQWIRYSYSSGAVYGANSRGFIGSKPTNRTDPVRDSYYDINTSGRSGTNMEAKGLTTPEMQIQESFVDWDFENIWQIEEGYPTLRNTP